MRCKACNCFLTETELMMVKDDNTSEDMCYDCRSVSYNSESLEVREYQHQHLTEMIENFYYLKNIKKDNENA